MMNEFITDRFNAVLLLWFLLLPATDVSFVVANNTEFNKARGAT